MSITNTQKAILDSDTIELIKAGYLSADLKITDSCRYYLEHLNFMTNKAELVKRAKANNKEVEGKTAAV